MIPVLYSTHITHLPIKKRLHTHTYYVRIITFPFGKEKVGINMETEIKKNKRIWLYSLLTLFFSILLLVGITASNINFNSTFLVQGVERGSDYTLTLNSSNSVSSAGEVNQYTARGNKVAFTYTDVTSSSGNHTRLNTNGTIVNKESKIGRASCRERG